MKNIEWLENLPAEFWEECKGTPSYHIARAFGCRTGDVLLLRKKLGVLDKEKEFECRFEGKHGVGSLQQLKMMFEDPLISLKEAGDRFGFTREGARQYFEKIFGKKYGDCKPNRKECKVRFFRGRTYELYVAAVSILEKQKFKPELLVYKSSYRIRVNNFSVAARRMSRTRVNAKSNLYFHTSTRGKSAADFFLCFCEEGSYVIPGKVMPTGITIPSNNRESKYQKYRDNWDLLRGEENVCSK